MAAASLCEKSGARQRQNLRQYPVRPPSQPLIITFFSIAAFAQMRWRMSVDPAFLAKISLFAPLDDDERAVLAQAMVDRQVKPGEVLFRAGEPGDSMFIVVEGGIELRPPPRRARSTFSQQARVARVSHYPLRNTKARSFWPSAKSLLAKLE